MTRYTAAHWGLFEVAPDETGAPTLRPTRLDPDPNPIGLDQFEDRVTRLRVRRPAIRQSWLRDGSGPRERDPHEPFVELSWEDALARVAAELERVRAAHGNTAVFGGSYGWSSAGRFHHAQSQVHRFLNAFGGYVRHVDSYSIGAGRVILRRVVGEFDRLMNLQTSWDVMAEHTELFVAFGGVPAKNARVSPGGATHHSLAGSLRDMAGTRLVSVSPTRDSFEVDDRVEWIPIRPGTDTALMLALIHVLISEGLAGSAFLDRNCTGHERLFAYVRGESDGRAKDPAWAEAITGIPTARITALARDMASHRTMVSIAYALQRAQHGEQPFWGIVALAATLGQIGLPGGGFGIGYGAMNAIGSPYPTLQGPALPQGQNPVSAFIPVARIADLLLEPGGSFTYDGVLHRYPDIRLIYWAGGNPFHHHQDLNRLRRAWQRPDSIIMHEQYWTAAARQADIVLPATTAAERDDIGFAGRERFIVAMRQVRPPLAEARDDYAIFSDLASRLGISDTFTEGRTPAEWLPVLYAKLQASAAAKDIALPDFAAFWEQGVIDLAPHRRRMVFLEQFRADPAANPVQTPSGRIELFSDSLAALGLPDCPAHPAWLGVEEPGDRLHLLSDQPSGRLHSQLDHSASSINAKRAGREPVFLHPEDAAAQDIADGDIVELYNERGRCLAVATITDGILQGVVRMSTGAWYDPGADGLEKHGNPNVLTADIPASALSQGCAAQTCLVRLRRYQGNDTTITAHSLPAGVSAG